MIGDKYIIVKGFEDSEYRFSSIKCGDILTVGNTRNGMSGKIEELYYNGKYVCDVGSVLELDYCKLYKEPSKSIHIYTDGTTTTAMLKEGNEDVELVLSKLFEVKRESNIKEGFKPYIRKTTENKNKLGYLGELTNFTDIVGRKLYVGDTVKVFYENGKESSGGESLIVKEHDRFHLMGAYYSDFITGEASGLKIIKSRSFEEIENGEIIRDIKYVKSDNIKDNFRFYTNFEKKDIDIYSHK